MSGVGDQGSGGCVHRRGFLTLIGATGAVPLGTRPARHRETPLWRFVLDGRLRWSLVPRRGSAAVAGAEIAVRFADGAPVPLAALTDVHRFPSGENGAPSTTVVGRTGAVEVAATFADGERPTITVRVRGLGAERALRDVQFLDLMVPRAQRGRRLAWINGYQSWSACRVVELDGTSEATGHWQLALLGQPGLALAFGEDDAGAGEFQLAGTRLVAVSRCGGRPVGATVPAATTTLRILPGDDPLAALGTLVSLGEAPEGRPAPAGWCSWYELFERVTEADVIANLEVARREFDPRAFRVIQLDDGYQRAAGDWDTSDKFPHGHRWLTEQIHAAGFEAGLWIAPFAVTERSGIPAAHPDWLLLGEYGAPLPFDDQPHWGGRAWGLDAAQRDVQDFLRNLTRHAVTEWGYDYLKLDFLYYGARGTRPGRRLGPTEAYRAGMRALREGAGRAFVLGCGAPLQHSLGLVHGMRIGGDVDASWGGIQPAAQATMLRLHLDAAWHNDPDALVVREPLQGDEARAWASVVALSGGMTLFSDHLPRLRADRFAILRRTIPVAPVRARVLDLGTGEPQRAPALLAGDTVLARLPPRWRFRAGDDAAWSDPALDDSAWEEIPIGVPWERAGHEGLDGYAWYRARFRAPARAPARPQAGALVLELGKIDDVDETFVNGVRVGGSGAFPPNYRAEWQTYRRYPVPREAVRWGRANVVAVRVYDGGGAGGMWRLTRDRPPSVMLARAQAGGRDWWTLALVNWDDEPRRLRADLAGHGVRGPLAAYDVWAETRRPDVQGVVQLTVAPRSAAVLGLRRPGRGPFVLGTTRHVVQGAVDLERETWDARRRILAGRSVQLDRGPYAVTIAVPPGMHPRACRAGVACQVTHAHGGARAAAIRLEFPEPAPEIDWEVEF